VGSFYKLQTKRAMNEDRKIDEAFLSEMMKRGEKAWKDVPDATAWVEELRNGTLDESQANMIQNEMNDTPTPRTDAYERHYIETGNVSKLINLARDLERELAEVAKQRDHYKSACDQYSEDEMLCKLREVTKQRDALAEALASLLSGVKDGWFNEGKWWHTGIEQAEQALATTKGAEL
jgi:hypothetical protein